MDLEGGGWVGGTGLFWNCHNMHVGEQHLKDFIIRGFLGYLIKLCAFQNFHLAALIN